MASEKDHACRHARSFQSCPTLCDPMDCSPPAPLSMGFSRQEYWSGLPLVIFKTVLIIRKDRAGNNVEHES